MNDRAEVIEALRRVLSDEERRLLEEAVAPARPERPDLAEAFARQVLALSARRTAEEEAIAGKAAALTADALADVVAAAKTGDLRAMHKLEAFTRFKDPQLAARVATMNRATRRAFLAARRGKKPSRRGRR